MAEYIAIIVFILVMVCIVTEKVHRAVAAIAGASVLIVTGVLSFDKAISHVDFNTLGVLMGMYLSRHKTQHKRFSITRPILVLVQAIIVLIIVLAQKP